MLRSCRLLPIAVALLVPAATASAREACQERTLSLRYSPQEGRRWCWAASGQMVMEWLGEKPGRSCQCRQAERVLGVTGCCASSTSCTRATDAPAACDEPRWPAFVDRPERYRFDYETTCDDLPGRQDDGACDMRPLGWRELAAEICAGRPVLAALRAAGSTQGHVVVVKGFSTRPSRRVLVVDPLQLCPPRARLRRRAGRGLLAALRGVRRGLGRPPPLGRLPRNPRALTPRRTPFRKT